MSGKFLKNRALSGLLMGKIILILMAAGIFTNTFNSLNQHFSDYLYTRNEPSPEIVIIAVDDKSTQPFPEGFGRFSQWTRERFTQLLEVLKDENSKVITFDFIFHTPTETLSKIILRGFYEEIIGLNNKEKLEKYEEFFIKYQSSLDDPIDENFSRTILKFDNMILAGSLHPDGKNLIKPLLKFALKAKVGVVNALLDSKGILRQSTPVFYIENEKKHYQDLALATVIKYLDAKEISAENYSKNPLIIESPAKSIQIPLKSGQLNVNFFGQPGSYKMISFVDVVNGKFDNNFFNNKIVLIGSTASKEIHDEYFTPKSNITPMPGIEFRANEIQTILEEKFLTSQDLASQILTTGLSAIGLTIALNYLNILFSILVSFMAIGSYILAAHFFYRQGLILNLIYPVSAILLAYLSSWIYKYFIADKNKREITSAFGHYVSPELVKKISRNPELVKLGGEKKIVTVFFSDIKDSTTHAEKVAPEVWVGQVNEYFTAMEKILKSYDGTLDKYEGDAIMGFWNAPISQNDHIERAYITALDMKEVLKKLNGKWTAENKPIIEIRIGINTGEALVGNFGSSSRFDYTVMGDTVNTASRLESSANKAYGTRIIVSGMLSSGTIPDLISQKFILRELDTVILPGKKEPVKLYELMGSANQSNSKELKKIMEIYAAGLRTYRQKDFKTALEKFFSLPDDKPSQIMSERCRILQTNTKITELNDDLTFHIANK